MMSKSIDKLDVSNEIPQISVSFSSNNGLHDSSYRKILHPMPSAKELENIATLDTYRNKKRIRRDMSFSSRTARSSLSSMKHPLTLQEKAMFKSVLSYNF